MQKPLAELIMLIDEPNRSKCEKMLSDHSERFSIAPGSLTKHQAWPGGYLDHLAETMNLAVILYKSMNSERALPFSISDTILVLFLHDLEKPFKYVEPKKEFLGANAEHDFVNSIVQEYNIELSDDHRNALKYIHGEGADYHPTKRIAGPLAIFCHMCDFASARIWFDFPKK